MHPSTGSSTTPSSRKTLRPYRQPAISSLAPRCVISNIAILGGNVAHALPAADGTIALLALGATADIANPEGLRQVPIQSLFSGPGKFTLDKSNELIAGFFIPLADSGQASVFKRIIPPQGVALPNLNCTVWNARDGNLVKDSRIAVGPGGPTRFRATVEEKILQGKTFDKELLQKAGEALLTKGSFRTSPPSGNL